MIADDLAGLKQWLVTCPYVNDGGRTFAAGLASALKSAGIPIYRQSYTLTTMHPEVLWRSMIWEEGKDVDFIDRPHAQLHTPFYLTSPIPRLLRGEAPIHVPLTQPDLPYPICKDLYEQGCTDYYAQGLPYASGDVGYISWATKRKGGFQPDQIRLLEELNPFLARRVELESSYRVNSLLLEVYLGRNASRRVLAGSFKRGQGELIPAAIWFCDLRGFTEMSDSRSPQEVIAVLDSYFDIVSNAVDTHGGEVLKFIGDAVLAIFPIEADQGSSCRAALDAAVTALRDVARLSKEISESGGSSLSVGIGLHLGEVMYGNVGGRARLDFTVISSAVNEASRLESLCKELKTSLAMSEAFVEASACKNVIDLGSHAVKGVKKPMRVYTLQNQRE